MASGFASISDEEFEVKEFTEKLVLENENTKKKTLYDIKAFKEYLDACDEKVLLYFLFAIKPSRICKP